jgi:hypothetical protein
MSASLTDPHQCKHCQRFILNSCGRIPEGLIAEQHIAIDCESINSRSTTISRDIINGIDSGKCAFLDFLRDIGGASDEVRIETGDFTKPINFTSGTDMASLKLAADSGEFLM